MYAWGGSSATGVLVALVLGTLVGCGGRSIDSGESSAPGGSDGEGGGGTRGGRGGGGGTDIGGTTGGTSSGGSVENGGTTNGGSDASGGDGASGGSDGGSGPCGGRGPIAIIDHPTDVSQVGMEAFLAAEGYASPCNGFRPETTPSDGSSLPHLAAKRYFNETLIVSKAAGNRSPNSTHFAGSMVIKEMLEGTAVVGKAAMLRTEDSWVYYCMSSLENRCFLDSMPNVASYGATAGSSCACHGSGNIIGHDAIPAP